MKNNDIQPSDASARPAAWLPISITAGMSLVLLGLALDGFMDDGRFVFRTMLLAAAGIGTATMSLAFHFKK